MTGDPRYQPTGCRSCRSAIRWVTTVDGKPMPIDLGRDPTGILILVKITKAKGPPDWRVRVLRRDETPDPNIPRYTPHWATCPDANGWRAQRAVSDPKGKTRRDDAPEGVTQGPCVRCGGLHQRYGEGGQPLCPKCRSTPRVDV